MKYQQALEHLRIALTGDSFCFVICENQNPADRDAVIKARGESAVLFKYLETAEQIEGLSKAGVTHLVDGHAWFSESPENR